MFQFHHPGATPPTLAEAADAWGLEPGEVDAGYGVIPVDLSAGIYVIRVTPAGAASLAARLPGMTGLHPATGLFGDPPQEPAR